MSEWPPNRQPGDRNYSPGSDPPTSVNRPDDRTEVYTGPAYGVQPGYGQQPSARYGATPSERRRHSVDTAALWSGGVVSAIVAALVALAGLIVIRGILHINVLAPAHAGTIGNVSTVWLVMASFAFGLAATAVLHGLLLTTPQPITYFGWIVGLVTVIVALLPFTTPARLETKTATALLYLVIGLIGGALIAGAGARARRGSLPGNF
ncbi:MAG: hypothetical protein QOF92_3293 [Pseudonocardiales bacterium]|jgi:hypothetical protein|nr:hypothetical protein [Pseudonocardiales bacterium]